MKVLVLLLFTVFTLFTAGIAPASASGFGRVICESPNSKLVAGHYGLGDPLQIEIGHAQLFSEAFPLLPSHGRAYSLPKAAAPNGEARCSRTDGLSFP